MHPGMAGSVSSTNPDFAVWHLPSIKSGPLRSFAQGRSINSVPAEGPPNRGPEPSRSSTESKTSSGRAKLHGAGSSNRAPASQKKKAEPWRPAPRCVCMIAITWEYRWEAAREGNSRVGFAPAQPCGPDLYRDIARRSHSRALWLGNWSPEPENSDFRGPTFSTVTGWNRLRSGQIFPFTARY